MWRSAASRLLRRPLLAAAAGGGGGHPRWPPHPPPPPPRFCFAAVPPAPLGGDGWGKGPGEECMTHSEAKKLMRLVNVEALKRRLGAMNGEEVVGYSDLLDACEGTGVVRSREEAAAFARVLDEAGVVLLFRDKVYLHPDKVVDLFFRLTFWEFSWDVMEPIAKETMRQSAASRLLLRPLLAGGGGHPRLLPHPPPPLSLIYSTSLPPPSSSPPAYLVRPARYFFSGTRSISNPLRYWNARKLGVSNLCSGYSTRTSNFKSKYLGNIKNIPDQEGIQQESNPMMISQQDNQAVDNHRRGATVLARNQRVGENISAVDKRKFLINTLFDLKDSKEAVYDTLDAWVAWEHNFPLVSLKRALLALEKEHQWHRIVQVLKWMLSKGQGTTMGTYEQLIRALEKDNRAEEAHKIWVKKISHDLHSVPWRFCDLMISIYYRNNMLERLVKLFKGLESYDRIPPTKSIVQKVADAYEMLGLLEEKSRVMEKYKDIFNKPPEGHFKKRRKAASRKNGKEADKKNPGRIEASDNQIDTGSSDGENDDSLKC